MQFGKRLLSTDIVPIIRNVQWEAGTVYDAYDNTANNLWSSTFYVVSPTVYGNYEIYKCIDNANGSTSTICPDQAQATSFQKSDGYVWHYITTISALDYSRFATSQYIPIIPNTAIQSVASEYSGIDRVVLTSGGAGYSTYTNGVIQSLVNSTIVQLANYSQPDDDFYTNSAIMIWNEGETTTQITLIDAYIVNSTGNWVALHEAVNTTPIIAGRTLYDISPAVVFESDAASPPIARTIINSYGNSISSVELLEIGTGVYWANVVIQANASYGNGAVGYVVVPPPGGHGYHPEKELGLLGFAVNFTFANTEAGTIPTETRYSRIGLIKNPYAQDADLTAGNRFSANTFDQMLIANVNPIVAFANGAALLGTNSGSRGVVCHMTDANVFIVGDQSFQAGETITDGTLSTVIQDVPQIGDLYARDLELLYLQTISSVTRSNTQAETFKITVTVPTA